ncbi:Hypothetical protein A7982_01831 [Minicystis rosea]|nr:Hypothetical protein A7982_01831 [Minicystis rosea]
MDRPRPERLERSAPLDGDPAARFDVHQTPASKRAHGMLVWLPLNMERLGRSSLRDRIRLFGG